MLGVRPSESYPPSICGAAVAAPQRKPSGKAFLLTSYPPCLCNGEVQQIQFAGAFETKIQGRLGKRETNTCLCPPCIWTNIYFSDTIAVDLCEQAKFTACSAADRSNDAGGIGQIKIFITGNSFVFYICNILAGITFTVFSFLGYVRIRALVGLCCFTCALFSVQHAGNPRFIIHSRPRRSGEKKTVPVECCR